MKNLLISNRNTPLKKPEELRQDIQADKGITPPTIYSEEDVRAPEEVLHRRHPKGYPHTPLLLLATRRESPSVKQQPLDQSEDCDA